MKTDTVTLPGRHPCQCLAQKHKLVNNCSSCGRIVCEQEGSGNFKDYTVKYDPVN